MKALEVATKSKEKFEGYDSFDIEPGVMYPAAIEHCTRLQASFAKLKEGTPLTAKDEPIPAYLRPNPMNYVQRLPANAKDFATMPFETAGALPAEEQLVRDFTLETARLVFTAILREENGRAVHVHILAADGAWRLCNGNIQMDAVQ